MHRRRDGVCPTIKTRPSRSNVPKRTAIALGSPFNCFNCFDQRHPRGSSRKACTAAGKFASKLERKRLEARVRVDLKFHETSDAATEMTMQGMTTQKAGTIGREFSASAAGTR